VLEAGFCIAKLIKSCTLTKTIGNNGDYFIFIVWKNSEISLNGRFLESAHVSVKCWGFPLSPSESISFTFLASP
jgi:hypothetical protein